MEATWFLFGRPCHQIAHQVRSHSTRGDPITKLLNHFRPFRRGHGPSHAAAWHIIQVGRPVPSNYRSFIIKLYSSCWDGFPSFSLYLSVTKRSPKIRKTNGFPKFTRRKCFAPLLSHISNSLPTPDLHQSLSVFRCLTPPRVEYRFIHGGRLHQISRGWPQALQADILREGPVGDAAEAGVDG